MDVKPICLAIIFASCNLFGLTEGIAFLNGGHEAQPGEFAWQVSLLSKNRGNFIYRCTGVIISKYWILSSASCIKSRRREEYAWTTFIYARSLNLERPGIVYKSNQVIYHPDYYLNSYANDLALIKTNHEIKFHLLARPIGLATSPITSFASGDLAGWGAAYYGGMTPVHKLRIARMDVISRDECQALLATEKKSISADQFCASAVGTGACDGDDGGAFVTNNYELAGIISQYFCTLDDLPTVFVDVFYHRDWIRNVTGV